jgi:hypothetical protein
VDLCGGSVAVSPTPSPDRSFYSDDKIEAGGILVVARLYVLVEVANLFV